MVLKVRKGRKHGFGDAEGQKTWFWNCGRAETTKSLIKIDDKPIGNVREFWYLEHLATDDKNNVKFLQAQIGTVYGKCNEFKDIFLDPG